MGVSKGSTADTVGGADALFQEPPSCCDEKAKSEPKLGGVHGVTTVLAKVSQRPTPLSFVATRQTTHPVTRARAARPFLVWLRAPWASRASRVAATRQRKGRLLLEEEEAASGLGPASGSGRGPMRRVRGGAPAGGRRRARRRRRTDRESGAVGVGWMEA